MTSIFAISFVFIWSHSKWHTVCMTCCTKLLPKLIRKLIVCPSALLVQRCINARKLQARERFRFSQHFQSWWELQLIHRFDERFQCTPLSGVGLARKAATKTENNPPYVSPITFHRTLPKSEASFSSLLNFQSLSLNSGLLLRKWKHHWEWSLRLTMPVSDPEMTLLSSFDYTTSNIHICLEDE